MYQFKPFNLLVNLYLLYICIFNIENYTWLKVSTYWLTWNHLDVVIEIVVLLPIVDFECAH